MSAYVWVGLAVAVALVSVASASIIVIARAGLWINRDLKRRLSSVDERARQRYERSPFKTTLRTWDELTPKEREPWEQLVAPACADSEDRLY